MTELKELNIKTLENIILCDPITSRGIEALDDLNDSTLKDALDKKYFFLNLHVDPKYKSNSAYAPIKDDKRLLYPHYAITEINFKRNKDKLNTFNENFTSDSKNKSPLIITGTAGIGKSIEINHKIYESNNINTYCVYCNMENSPTDFDHILPPYRVTDSHNVLELCVILLLHLLYDEVEKTISKNPQNKQTIFDNFKEYFVNKNIYNPYEYNFFNAIQKINLVNRSLMGNFVKSLGDIKDQNSPEIAIDMLLSLIMKFIYCSNPCNKNYIIFDNIENYIKLHSKRYVYVPNQFLDQIYDIISQRITNSELNYDKICKGQIWKSFKIVIVMRRTTTDQLVENQQYLARSKENENDYSGYFEIWDIWAKKKEHVWNKFLKSNYINESSSEIINILDTMMKDNPDTDKRGITYQARISPLMNMGIRRNAGVQAYTAINVYEILNKNYKSYITKNQYAMLIQKTDITKYIFRMALMEIHHKWMITCEESQTRFKNLLIGELHPALDVKTEDAPNALNEKGEVLHDKSSLPIKIRNVIKNNTNTATYVRRILSFLSRSPEPETNMYRTISLFEIMKTIFINHANENKAPVTNDIDPKTDFLPLATVLLSLGDMLHKDTKCGPFIILEVNDQRIISNEPEKNLAKILSEIWDAKESGSVDKDGLYRSSKFGARITDAGVVFLKDIQPSFSFFAALYCSEEVPLFFLTDIARIKLVIQKVYDSANNLCTVYEETAIGFCGKSTIDYPDTKYLYEFSYEGNIYYSTFRRHVKQMHYQYLEDYKKYIEDNKRILLFSESETNALYSHIETYKNKYNGWELTKKCF